MTYEELKQAAAVISHAKEMKYYVSKERFALAALTQFGIDDEKSVDIMYGFFCRIPDIVRRIADGEKLTEKYLPKAIEIAEAAYSLRGGDGYDKDKILSFLKALRKSDFFIEYIYTRGGCYQLYKVLKSLWPSAQPYLGVHMAHVITRIGDRYFDINGEVKIDGDFLPMTAEKEQEAATWSFAGNNELYLGHCPVCDEPITIDRNKLIKPKD